MGPAVSATDFPAQLRECKTRDEAARIYADAMLSMRRASVDFPTINAAILSKWTPSGLNYIKVQAWKLIDKKK